MMLLYYKCSECPNITNIEVFLSSLFLLTHIDCYYKKQYHSRRRHSRTSTNDSNVNSIDNITYMK